MHTGAAAGVRALARRCPTARRRRRPPPTCRPARPRHIRVLYRPPMPILSHQAVTCDDFLAAMADANGEDLSDLAK